MDGHFRDGQRVLVRAVETRDGDEVSLLRPVIGTVARRRMKDRGAWVKLDARIRVPDGIHPFPVDDEAGRGNHVLTFPDLCDEVPGSPPQVAHPEPVQPVAVPKIEAIMAMAEVLSDHNPSVSEVTLFYRPRDGAKPWTLYIACGVLTIKAESYEAALQVAHDTLSGAVKERIERLSKSLQSVAT